MTLETVGSFLHQEALRRGDPERDVFGRSSFNRFYYAAFLEARGALGGLKNEWTTLSHASIPDLLRKSVSDAFKKGRLKAQKMDDVEGIRACTLAISAAKDLADILALGYSVRVVADYNIELSVNFQSISSFSLNEISIDLAKKWPGRARGLANSIVIANKQLNVFS